MPLPFVQALINVPNFIVVRATAWTDATLAPLARMTGRAVALSVQPVARASSPRPMATRASIALNAVASSQLTTAGIVNGRMTLGFVPQITMSSQVYDVRRPKGYGQVTYGVQQLPSGVSRLSFPLSELGMPSAVGAGASWTSGPVDCLGLQHITWGMQASQPIIMAVNRYVDPSCQSPIGAAVTATAVANTALALDCNDGKGYSGFTLGFTNTAASVATLSSYNFMLESV